MNRRAFVGAGAAVVGAATLPRVGFGAGWEGAGVGGELVKPVDLLAGTFGPLVGSLLTADLWRPMPKGSDRAGWGAVPEDVRAALVERADAVNNDKWPALLAIEELAFKRDGNRSRFEALTFGRRSRLGDLVVGECCTGAGKYLDQIANGVWLICEESFWGAPAHLGVQRAGVGLADVAEPIVELFGAETAATLAWVVYLLGGELGTVSPLLVPRVKMEAKRRILDVYFERTDFGWMGLNGKPHHVNNWNPWIASNVLTAALVLEPEGPRRGQMVGKICRSVDQYLADYSADAGCEEGPGYWGRSAASYFDCCETLVSAHGGKGGTVLTNPFTRAMGHFIADVHIAKSLYVNFGDAHVDSAPEPMEVYRFGRATGDEVLAEFGAFDGVRRGAGAAGAAMRGALRTDGGGPASLSRTLGQVLAVREVRGAKQEDALVRDSWYPKLGLMTARQTEGSAEGFYVAFQAASNGRPHGHNDSGSFIVFYAGEPVFIDVGVEQYTAQTFGKDRYKLWTMQSGFHNLPTIGGVMQHEGDGFRASELGYETAGGRTSVRANLGTAYPKEAGVERWMRTLTLDRAAGRVEVVEDFLLAKEAGVALSLMAAKVPVVEAGGVRVGGVRLGFDAAMMQATVERIALTDPGLRHSWGEAVWRVLLTSVGAVKTGSWRMEMRGL